MDSPHRVVSSLTSRIQPLEIEFHRAYWESQIDATPETERVRAEREFALRSAKGDRAALAAVNDCLEHEIHDSVLRRQLQILRLSLTGNQMDEAQRRHIVEVSSSIESDFASHRPALDGRQVSDNDIERILKTSDDEVSRRNAWFASKTVGGVVGNRVRELVRARNHVALSLGFADYYGMSLELQELPEDWLFETLDELDRLTEPAFRSWKSDLDAQLSDRFKTSQVMPWHYADPFFQTVPSVGRLDMDALVAGVSAEEAVAKTFAAWGIDVTAILGRSDLYPRARKSQHAFCLDVDRTGKDVRILANIVPGARWVEVLLHEMGHAAYDVSIDTKLPNLLRRPSHIFVTEAIAIFSGRLVRDPEWLRSFANVPEDRFDGSAIEQANAAQSLLFARWGLVMAHFERALYTDPEGDLDAIWWELVSRFQLIEPPDPAPAGAWASKIHIAVAPVYYQNYILGELLASQLTEAIERQGSDEPRAAGDFLKQRVFRPGAFMRWGSLIEEATGSALSARSFAAEIGAGVR